MVGPKSADDAANLSRSGATSHSGIAMSDEVIVAQLRAKERRARRVVYLVVPLVSILAFSVAFIGGRGKMHLAPWGAVGLFCAVILASVGWLIWQRASPESYGPRIIVRRTDEIQRGRSRQLWVLPAEVVCLAPLVVAGTQYVMDRGGPKLLGLPGGIATIGFLVLLAAGILVMLAVTMLMLIGVGYPEALRPALNDELSRAQRSKAIASGFVAAMVGGIVVYGAGLIEPRWAVLGLPFVVMGSLAVAAVHFVILDQCADAGV